MDKKVVNMREDDCHEIYMQGYEKGRADEREKALEVLEQVRNLTLQGRLSSRVSQSKPTRRGSDGYLQSEKKIRR